MGVVAKQGILLYVIPTPTAGEHQDGTNKPIEKQE
jgi:hypothetical protein